MDYSIDNNGYYGEFGGAYIPEILHGTVERLKEAYFAIKEDDSFRAEYYDRSGHQLDFADWPA